MSIIPFRFQLHDVRQYHKFNGRILDASSMGLGKTIKTLMYIERHPAIRPIVVVCPKSIMWNWENEAKHHIGMRAEVLDTPRPPKDQVLAPPQMFIINFDALYKWVKWLRKLKPQLIVVDEVVYCMNSGTRRTKAVRALCKNVPHVVGLGGTGGMNNRPIEMFPILNILHPKVFPSLYSFGHRFCGPKREFGHWTFKGATNLAQLHKLLLSTCVIRRRTEDVLPDLPKQRRMVVTLDIANREVYDTAFKDFLGWVREQYGKVKERRARKAEQINRITYLSHLTAQLKLPAVMDWLDTFLHETDEKMIVFGIHHDILGKLHERYESGSVIVTGKVTGKKRKLAFNQFVKTKKTRLLFGNIQAAGVGWSALGVPKVAFPEFGWTSAEHDQAEKRVSGIGRGVEGRRSEAYYLVARGTLEHKRLELIQKKQTVLNRILDGREIKEEMDIYDLLTKELLKGDEQRRNEH